MEHEDTPDAGMVLACKESNNFGRQAEDNGCNQSGHEECGWEPCCHHCKFLVWKRSMLERKLSKNRSKVTLAENEL